MEIYTNSYYFGQKVEEALDLEIIGLKLLKEDIEEEVEVGQPSPKQLKLSLTPKSWAWPKLSWQLNAEFRPILIKLSRAQLGHGPAGKAIPNAIGVELGVNVVQNLFEECLC